MPLADLVLGRPPHTPQADAASGLDNGVTIYWRDGCPFCLRLRVEPGSDDSDLVGTSRNRATS